MRVIVAEDHVLFREVVVRICQECGYEVVAAVGNGHAAVAACLVHSVDLLVLDFQLEALAGGAVVDLLVRERRLPRVLVISAFLSEYLVYRLDRLALTAGFLSKAAAGLDELRGTLREVAAGRRYFCKAYLDLRAALRSNPRSFDKVLTARQELVMYYVAIDATDEGIALALGVSTRTVEGYRSVLMRKLAVGSSVQLAAYARTRGFDLFPPVGVPSGGGPTEYADETDRPLCRLAAAPVFAR